MTLRATLAALALAATTPALAQEPLDLFSVGSGDPAGGYYAMARAVCDAFNRDPAHRGLRCSPEPTQGSIYNLAMIELGELDFALTQSDWQAAAYRGESRFAELGPQTDLRGVISLYPESVTVLAAVGSGIRTSADLAGKRIDIGKPSSGRHATIMALLERLGNGDGEFADLRELDPRTSIGELCDGRLDAAIFVIGHPSRLIGDAVERCGARLVPLDGDEIVGTLGTAEEFEQIEIAADTYLGQSEAVRTWAVYATLVAPLHVPETTVRLLVETILKHRSRLEETSPLAAGASVGDMRLRAMTAPLHPGAMAAFDAVGG